MSSTVNEFSYEIVSGNEAGKFRIDAGSGELLVNRVLDYDKPNLDRNVSGVEGVVDCRVEEVVGCRREVVVECRVGEVVGCRMEVVVE